MPLEPYSPEFGRSWADERPKEAAVTPATPKFYMIEKVVMVESVPSRDDGYPDSKVETVIAENKLEIRSQNISEYVGKVLRSR